MKSFLLSAVAVMALVYQPCVHAQAPIPPGAVKLGKIAPEGVKTPEYNITGGPQKRFKIGQWLEIEVEFETKMEEIAELKFDYIVMIDGKLVTGTVTHINIPKGRDHYSVMYIAPRTLEKITGGRPITQGSIQNTWVSVSTPDGVDLDKASTKKEAVPNLPKQPGLLNKSETPFAPLFFDRYEAIKTTR